ncbi:MAG: site-specific integrase [Lachnospiraceae bacterium]|nr:site-specific integrase [Lachnospiraceae bacterium]
MHNGIYYYAIEDGIVAHNPIKDINYRQFPFKPVNNADDVFTREERKKLLAHLANNDSIYSLAIQLDFQLVVRIGELLSLRWSDIKNGYIHIQSQLLTERKMNDDLTFTKREHVNVDHVKGNTSQGFRFQPLTDEAIRILEKIREQNPNGEFILMHDGRQLNANSFNRWLKRYCEECNIPVRSSHKIRFCVASMLHENGMPLTVLQQLLGHTTTAMTLHYLRRVTPTKDTSNLMNMALC